MLSVPFDNNVLLAPGMGFDSIFGVPKEVFAKASAEERSAPFQDLPARVSLRYTHLSERSEQLESLSLGASAAFSVGPYSASGAVNSFELQNRSSFHEYLLACVEVELERVVIPDLDLPPVEADPFLFFDRYGDRYVSGYVKGGSLWVLYDFVTENFREQRELRASFSGAAGFSGGGASLSASFARACEKFEEKKRLSIQLVRHGAQDELPDLSQEATRLEQLSRYITEFPNRLRNQNTYWTIRYLLSEYPKRLASDEHQPPKGRQNTNGDAERTVKRALRTLFKMYTAFARRLAGLRSIAANPFDFGGVHWPTLMDEIRYIEPIVFEIRERVEDLLDQPVRTRGAAVQELIRAYQEAFQALGTGPERIDWTVIDKAATGNWQDITKTQDGEEQRWLLVGGAWSYVGENWNSDRRGSLIPFEDRDNGQVITELAFNDRIISRDDAAVQSALRKQQPINIPAKTHVRFRVVDGEHGDNYVNLKVGVYTPVHAGAIGLMAEGSESRSEHKNAGPLSAVETRSNAAVVFVNRTQRPIIIRWFAVDAAAAGGGTLLPGREDRVPASGDVLYRWSFRDDGPPADADNSDCRATASVPDSSIEIREDHPCRG